MSNERHETVADNVSANHQFREVAKMIPHEEVAVSKMETTTQTSEKSSAVGNAAAMREALDKILWCLAWMSNNAENKIIKDHLAKPIELAKSALSAPPRNCDRPECATTNAAQDVWRKEDGGKTAYYEWLFAEAKGYEK